jgi:hypothetical protein
MSETEQQDEAEKRAQTCLAKAIYCKWAASVTGDKELKDYYTRLSSEWQKDAQVAKGQDQ